MVKKEEATAEYIVTGATGIMVGFHLMNVSGAGSGIIEIKDA